jgi:hypothetical protein
VLLFVFDCAAHMSAESKFQNLMRWLKLLPPLAVSSGAPVADKYQIVMVGTHGSAPDEKLIDTTLWLTGDHKMRVERNFPYVHLHCKPASMFPVCAKKPADKPAVKLQTFIKELIATVMKDNAVLDTRAGSRSIQIDAKTAAELYRWAAADGPEDGAPNKPSKVRPERTAVLPTEKPPAFGEEGDFPEDAPGDEDERFDNSEFEEIDGKRKPIAQLV